MAEIEAFLEDPKGIGPAGPNMRPDEIEKRLAERGRMSNLEKLRNYQW